MNIIQSTTKDNTPLYAELSETEKKELKVCIKRGIYLTLYDEGMLTDIELEYLLEHICAYRDA